MPKSGRQLKKIAHARILVAHVLREVEKGGDIADLDRAKVLIMGAQALGKLINDAGTEAELETMRRELAELKAKIGLRVA